MKRYRDLPGPMSWGATPRIWIPLLTGRQAPPSQGLAEDADGELGSPNMRIRRG